MADATDHPSSSLLLRWRGCLTATAAVRERLELLSGVVLMLLLASLPFVTRSGLGLEIAAAGLLWLLWALITPAEGIGAISRWVLLYLAIALVSTGFSPVPIAATKGLLKLASYLGVFALMRTLLERQIIWWDRLLAALLGGGLLSSVLALRQLYASTEELAGWADPNSVSAGTIRIYGPLGNPNLLAGYLLPLVPLACIAVLRWRRLSLSHGGGSDRPAGGGRHAVHLQPRRLAGSPGGLGPGGTAAPAPRHSPLASPLATPAAPWRPGGWRHRSGIGDHSAGTDPHPGHEPAGRSR